ncbi:MAG: hypothetical protein OXU20_06670 [Myxococcales bacterium]|nr:hypothetical protein [Myxococcales bacterium]MDD9967272.1 hypothetical protein [Myxococcales bacterium]
MIRARATVAHGSKLGSFVHLAMILAGASCAGVPPTRDAREPQPIVDLVGALPAGADTVVVVRPARWVAYESGRQLLSILVPERAQADFEARFGAPLARLDELVVADYGPDRITIVRGVDASRVPSLQTGAPPAPHHPAVLDRRTVLVRAAGSAASIVRAMGDGFGDPGLLSLSATEVGRDLTVYVPHPLPLPPRSGIGTLLSQQTGLAASLEPGAAPDGLETLQLTVELHGRFPASAERNFRTLIDSIAADPLGVSLGLPAARSSLVLSATDHKVHISLQIPADAFVTTLERLLAPDVWRPIGAPGRSSGATHESH